MTSLVSEGQRPPMTIAPASVPTAPSQSKFDLTATIVVLIAGLLFFIWAAFILWTAISQGPITIAGLVGIGSYVGLLLYLVWRTGLEEEAENEHTKTRR
jgi:Ca2+/Na+ antiporter